MVKTAKDFVRPRRDKEATVEQASNYVVPLPSRTECFGAVLAFPFRRSHEPNVRHTHNNRRDGE